MSLGDVAVTMQFQEITITVELQGLWGLISDYKKLLGIQKYAYIYNSTISDDFSEEK